MRITKLLFTFLAMTFLTFTVKANNEPTTVREEIQTILQNAKFDVEKDKRIIVNFLINSSNQIIVISANDPTHEFNIKNLLDLKKIKASDVVYNKIYTLPIQLKKM